MFQYIKNIIIKIKEAHKIHKAEHEIYMRDFYFYRAESNLELYDRRPVIIFFNGMNIYSDIPCRILTEGSYYFSNYNYTQISYIKLCIFYTLIQPNEQGIEVCINGDRWKIIQSRWYFKSLLFLE